MKYSIAVFGLLGSLGFVSGCGFTNYPATSSAPVSVAPGGTTTPTSPPSGTAPPSGQATFSNVNSTILVPRCLSCHSSGSSPDFSSYSAFATDTAFVNPGNPASSALYTAVESGVMPKGGTALTSDEVLLVYDWIQQGALNN